MGVIVELPRMPMKEFEDGFELDIFDDCARLPSRAMAARFRRALHEVEKYEELASTVVSRIDLTGEGRT